MQVPSRSEIEALLSGQFRDWAGLPPTDIAPLPKAGSDRQYFRLSGGGASAIGAFNADRRENAAFTAFTRHFHAKGIPVPELFAEDARNCVYLQQDLGDLALLAHLQASRKGGDFPPEVVPLYKAALSALADMQIRGGEGLDYSLCYPREQFDKQSMMWDLSYFKYYFLKLAGVPFDEQGLEEDYHSLTNYLVRADCSHFMFRDFQARNIMLFEGKPYFIDYQGGRRGAIQYDAASLLYQAKARIPHRLRMEMLDHYMDAVEGHKHIHRGKFREYFFAYLLIRTLQVLGAYGFRGFYERRSHFLESIPYALDNLAWILEHEPPVLDLPVLGPALAALPQAEKLAALGRKWEEKSPLKVLVKSFSYKRGIPADPSEHGGGFVFDCRALHNPGRYDPYKKLTGRDQPVIDFLLRESKIEAFLANAKDLVERSVQRYIERGFTNLMVSFGCTGGQHRSVYCADQMTKFLKGKYPIQVELEHVEQELKDWKN